MPATYEPIASTTLGSTTSSVTFGSGGTLPQTYTDLIIVSSARSTRVDYDDATSITVNGDTAGNYSYTYLLGGGSNASSTRASNSSYIMGRHAAASAYSGLFTPQRFQFQSYANTNVYKTVLLETAEAPSGGADYGVMRTVGLWRNTAAITSITIGSVVAGFASGSTFALYGIKAA